MLIFWSLVCCWCVAGTLAKPAARRSPACDLNSPDQVCINDVPYPFFGTKTTYTNAYKHLKSLGLTVDELPNGYTPIMFYYFGRHGIRYPDGVEIEPMNEFMSNISSTINNTNSMNKKLCEDLQSKLEDFRSHWTPDDDNHVPPAGTKELAELGERYKNLLPSILDPSKENFKIDVGVSDKIRTTESASGFLQGLYGSSYNPEKNLNAQYRNVTTYHRSCREARNKVKKEPSKVVKDFKKSVIMTKLKAKIAERIGVPAEDLKPKQLQKLHDFCSYNYAINGSNVWCSIFTPEELKTMEYFIDLEDYYSVHRDKSMKKAACFLMSEILDTMSEAEGGKPSSTLRFSHSGAIRPFLNYLGLFDNFGSKKDKDHADFCANGEIEREWRTSLISPFGANVGFILLKRQSKNDLFVLTLVQEVPVKVEGCSKLICPLKKFRESFEKSVENCDVQAICRKDLE